MELSEKYIIGIRKNSQFYFCSFPFVLDTYSTCSHGCRYCFTYVNRLLNYSTAPTGEGFFEGEDLRAIDLDKVKKLFTSEKPKSKALQQLWELSSRRMPLHWGGLTDPFPRLLENQFSVSLKLLQYLCEMQYPILCSTKGGWIVDHPEYIEAIQSNPNFVLQVSLISSNQEKVSKLEPNAPVDDRLRLIEKVSKTNRVVVRMQPYIPLFSDDTWEKTVEDVAKRGANAVTVEWFKLSKFMSAPKCKIARDQLNEALGYDIVAYYKKFARATSTDFEMPPSKKINTIKKIRDKVHAEGMEFYSADNDFRHLGDGVSCCGVNCQDCFSGYEHRFTANTGRALEIAKEKGEVHFRDVFSEEAMSDIDKAYMTGDPKEYINQGSSENILRQRGKTWFDYALKNWDNPRSPNNPARFYVCLKPNGLDEEGHVIYKYYDV